MDEAFYHFTKNSNFSDVELVAYRAAARNLAQVLTDLSMTEATRRKDILKVLDLIFLENKQFKWTLGDHFRTDLVYRFLPSGFPEGTFELNGIPLIVVEVKLEEGHNGDAYMHYFDLIVRENPKYRATGAPIFLLTMSGAFLTCISRRSCDLINPLP